MAEDKNNSTVPENADAIDTVEAKDTADNSIAVENDLKMNESEDKKIAEQGDDALESKASDHPAKENSAEEEEKVSNPSDTPAGVSTPEEPKAENAAPTGAEKSAAREVEYYNTMRDKSGEDDGSHVLNVDENGEATVDSVDKQSPAAPEEKPAEPEVKPAEDTEKAPADDASEATGSLEDKSEPEVPKKILPKPEKPRPAYDEQSLADAAEEVSKFDKKRREKEGATDDEDMMLLSFDEDGSAKVEDVKREPESEKPADPEEKVTSPRETPEQKAAREVDNFLNKKDEEPDYNPGDRLVIDVEEEDDDDDDMVFTVTNDDWDDDAVPLADAMLEELDLMRKQRAELEELCDRHRKLLDAEEEKRNGEKSETTEEKTEETTENTTEETNEAKSEDAPEDKSEQTSEDKADDKSDDQTEEKSESEESEASPIDDATVLGVKSEGEGVIDRKSLKEYLRHSDKVRKNYEKQVTKAEQAFRKNEDENDSPALIAGILMKLESILEILCDNVSVCARLRHKSNVKRYSALLAESIDKYNKNVIAFYDLTGQQLTRVSAFLPEELSDGEKQAIIPSLSYRETYIEIYVENDGSVRDIDDSVTTTVITPPYSRRELLDDQDVETAADAKAYRNKAYAAIAKLSSERSKIESTIKENARKDEKCRAAVKKAKAKYKKILAKFNRNFTEKEHKNGYYKRGLAEINNKYGKKIIKAECELEKNSCERKNLKLLVETVAIEREKLDCMCTLLRKIRLISSDKVVDGVKRDFVRAMLEYNKLVEVCSAAIEVPIAKLSASLADEVARTGGEVLFPKMAYRRELVETVGEDKRIVGDRLKSAFVGDIGGDDAYGEIGATEGIDRNNYYGEKMFEFEQTAVNITREQSENITSKKGLVKFMKGTRRTEKMFTDSIKQIDKSIMKAIDDSNVVAMLVEYLRVSGRYIEFLAIRLVASSKFIGGKKLGHEIDLLYSEISRYNLRAIDYSNLTGEQVTRISSFLPERLAEGTAEILLPSLSYKESYVEVYPKKSDSKFESFEDVIDRRLADSYVPVLFKNRKLSENKTVTVTPINPPFSAEEMKAVEGATTYRAKRVNAREVRKSGRKLARGLRRIKRQLARLERSDKRFNKKFAALTRKHDEELFRIESLTSEHERQTPVYKKKLQNVNGKFASKSLKLKFKKARMSIERRKKKLYAERFAIEREYLAIACQNLRNMRSYGRPSVVAETKNNLIKMMSDYNRRADLCASLLGEPIAKMSSSIADEIIRDGKKEVKLPMLVCYRETVETVGDKVRTLGDRYRYGNYAVNNNGIGYDMNGNPVIGVSNAPVSGEIPLMPPIYGFMPNAISGTSTSVIGDAYEETYVNKSVVALSKYEIPALKAKSVVVECRKDYKRYKRISGALIKTVEGIVRNTGLDHARVDDALAKLREDVSRKEDKAYPRVYKRISRIIKKSRDSYVVAKMEHVLSVIEAMRKAKRPVSEMVDYANTVILRDLSPKFDLDNVCAVSKLVEIRSCDLYASSKINCGRYVKKDREVLSLEIERYNDCVIEYSSAAGERLTHISVLVPDKIAAKEGMPIIPELYYNEKFVEETLEVKSDYGAAYTLYIPSPMEIAAGATVATIPNPNLNKTENDKTIREIVTVPREFTIEELLKDTAEASAKKYVKIVGRAINRIDARIEENEEKIFKQSKLIKIRKKKIEAATRKYEKKMLRASSKAQNPVKYQKRIRRISSNYGKDIFGIDERYPAPELLESKRLRLESFALEQLKFTIVSMMLKYVAKTRNRRILTKAKRQFISSVIYYNTVADRVAAELGTSIGHIDEGYIDYVLIDGIIPTLRRLVYEKNVVEVVGDKRRIIGERLIQPSSAFTLVFGGGYPGGAAAFGSAAVPGYGAGAVYNNSYSSYPTPVSVPVRAVSDVPVYVYNDGPAPVAYAPVVEPDDGVLGVEPMAQPEAPEQKGDSFNIPVDDSRYATVPVQNGGAMYPVQTENGMIAAGGPGSSFSIPAQQGQYAQVPGTQNSMMIPMQNGQPIAGYPSANSAFPSIPASAAVQGQGAGNSFIPLNAQNSPQYGNNGRYGGSIAPVSNNGAALSANPGSHITVPINNGNNLYPNAQNSNLTTPMMGGAANNASAQANGGFIPMFGQQAGVAGANNAGYMPMMGDAANNASAQANGGFIPMAGQQAGVAGANNAGYMPMMGGAANNASAQANGGFIPMAGQQAGVAGANNAGYMPMMGGAANNASAQANGGFIPMFGQQAGVAGANNAGYMPMMGGAANNASAQANGGFIPMFGQQAGVTGANNAGYMPMMGGATNNASAQANGGFIPMFGQQAGVAGANNAGYMPMMGGAANNASAQANGGFIPMFGQQAGVAGASNIGYMPMMGGAANNASAQANGGFVPLNGHPTNSIVGNGSRTAIPMFNGAASIPTTSVNGGFIPMFGQQAGVAGANNAGYMPMMGDATNNASAQANGGFIPMFGQQAGTVGANNAGYMPVMGGTANNVAAQANGGFIPMFGQQAGVAGANNAGYMPMVGGAAGSTEIENEAMLLNMPGYYPEAPIVRNPAILHLDKQGASYAGRGGAGAFIPAFGPDGIPMEARGSAVPLAVAPGSVAYDKSRTITVPMAAFAPESEGGRARTINIPMQAYGQGAVAVENPGMLYMGSETATEQAEGGSVMMMPFDSGKKSGKKKMSPYFVPMPMYGNTADGKNRMDMPVPVMSVLPVAGSIGDAQFPVEIELPKMNTAPAAIMTFPGYEQAWKKAKTEYTPDGAVLSMTPDMQVVQGYNTLANASGSPRVIAVGTPDIRWDRSVVEKINRSELSGYINESKKKINKADRNIGKLLQTLEKTDVTEKPAIIVDCLGYCKEIIDEICDNMVAAVSVNETGVATKLSEVLKNQVRRYNALTKEFSDITKEPLPLASASMARNILAGKPYQVLPNLEYVPAKEEIRPLATEEDAEYRLTLNAEARRNDGLIMDLALQDKVAEQANKDLSVITKYCDFEISMLESARDIERFRFGKDDRVIKSNSRQIAKHIEKIKKTHREAIEYEARDNERYYTVVLADPETIPTRYKNPNRAKLDSIRTRLIVLLNRRDEINSMLSAIYTGTEKAPDGSSINQKWRHIKNCAAEKMARKDRALAKRVERVSATKGEKHRMFTLMNKRLDAASTLELCKFRLKYEKNTYRVKRTLKNDIKNCKTVLRHCKRDIDWMIKRFRSRDKEAGGSWLTALGFILLMVIGLAAGYVWLFREEIMELINLIFGS